MAVKLKIEGHPLFRDASVASVDKEKRTFDLVWTTGAKGKRTDFWTDKQWYEELAVDPQSIRMDRLNSGSAPLLNGHRAYDVSKDVIGVIKRAWLEGGQGMATVQMSRRADADAIFQDVQDGIIRNVSVGYRVYKWDDVSQDDDKIPTMRASDWEPFEVSLVPIGFDAGAQTRGGRQVESHSMEITLKRSGTLGAKPSQGGKTEMTPEEQRAADEAKRAAEKAQAEALERAKAEAVEDERKRADAITSRCAMLKLPEELGRALVKEGLTIKLANERFLDEIAKRANSEAATVTTTKGVQMGEQDEVKTRHDAAVNAVLHRADPKANPLTEAGREYRGMTLMEMARDFLGRSGVNVKGMGRNELAHAALKVRSGYGGFNAVGDFPNVLANVLNKSLLQGYEALFQKQTFRPFVTVKTAPDFKQVARTRLGEVPSLDLVPEGAEVKRGTIGDSKEVYNLATYSKIFGITREVIINDDLSAFTDIPRKFGAGASRLESDIVYAILTANANMGDGTALFASGHGNLAGSGAVISVTTIGTGRTAMRTQKGIAKKDYLNITPQFLLVPAAIETTADTFVSTNMLANAATSVNPFAGRLQVIAEPRLDAASTTAWYLMADPMTGVDLIELLYLDGATGLQVVTDVGFDRNGVEVKALLDVAAKALDWRGMYKNPGA